jgi:hypothetical protein
MQDPEAMHRKKKEWKNASSEIWVEFITRYRDARGGIWIEVTVGVLEPNETA